MATNLLLLHLLILLDWSSSSSNSFASSSTLLDARGNDVDPSIYKGNVLLIVNVSFTLVERWLDDLCEELSERIQSDMDLNNRVAHTLTLNAKVHKTNEPDSLKKFPSKSCPLRYGTTKLQEDAKKLFNSGLREFLGLFRAETRGHQNNTWAVTGLSVTAGKILATPGTRSILNYFQGKNPSCSSEEHINNENTQDTLPESRLEIFSTGNTSELLESKDEETQTNYSELYLDQDGNRTDKMNNKDPNSILRFFHSSQTSCSTSERTDSGVIQDNLPGLDQAKAHENDISTAAQHVCQGEPKKGSILRFFGNQSEPPIQTGKHKWNFSVDEIDPTVVDELPQEIQDEVRGWLKPPKRPNTSKRGSNIAQYFLPATDK